MMRYPLKTATFLIALLLVPAVALAAGDAGFEFKIHGYYIIDFFVFFGLLVYFGRKPIAAMLDQRHKTVSAEIDQALLIRAEAEAKYNQYRVRLDTLEDELATVMDDVRKGTQVEVDRILEDARKTADRISADEHTRLQQESKKIREQLAKHAAEMALGMAEVQVRTRLEKADAQALLTARVLTELEKRETEVQA